MFKFFLGEMISPKPPHYTKFIKPCRYFGFGSVTSVNKSS